MRKTKGAPNEKLSEGCGALDDGETDRLNVKLEKDTRNALVTNLSFIVCHTVLVCMQRFGAWCDVGRWNDSKEVVICEKSCKCYTGRTPKDITYHHA